MKISTVQHRSNSVDSRQLNVEQIRSWVDLDSCLKCIIGGVEM